MDPDSGAALRIVPDELWESVPERLTGERRRYLRLNDGRVLGRPPAVGTKYLLSGMLTCGVGGSSLEARTRSHGRQRVPFYGCAAHHRKGGTICANSFEIPMVDADEAILSTIERVMLDPSVVDEIVTRALAELQTDERPARLATLERDRARLDGELARLTEALVVGGDSLTSVVAALRAREAQRAEVQRSIEQLARPPAVRAFDGRSLRAQLEERVRAWRSLLRKHAEQGQQLLRP